ncbi:hypothetical protein MBLNU459_g3389t2 [Dothideomycetes sp. NU459]
MASQPPSGTDATSIKPVSSLRSKFENLMQEQPATPTVPSRKASLHPLVHDAPPASPVRASIEMPRPHNFLPAASHGLAKIDPAPLHKKRKPSPPRSRPLSMGPLALQQAPPAVSVQSPQSPPKNLELRLTTATPTKSPSPPVGSNSVSPAASIRHFRTPSRATTPALEARMSVFLQGSASSEHLPEADKRSLNGNQKPRSQHAGAPPPPVNRAGKPKLPNTSQTNLHSVDPFGKLAPENGDLSADERVSPFNTPPSSSDSTPADQHPPTMPSLSKPKMMGPSPGKRSYFPAVPPGRAVPDASREQSTKPTARSYEPRSPLTPSRAQSTHPTDFSTAPDGSEDVPELPPRPSQDVISGRTSPVRGQRIPARRSMDVPRRASAIVSDPIPQHMPPSRRMPHSALTQGFDRVSAMSSSAAVPAAGPIAAQKPPPPAVPAPRRSVESRREDVRPARSIPAMNTRITTRVDDHEDPPPLPAGASLPGLSPALNDFPDASQTNRRLPRFKHRPWEIATGYDTKLFAVCGEYVCTTGYITRVWSLRTGESCLTLAHGENVKVTAVAFKPTNDATQEGRRLWLGTSVGEINEVDIPSQSVINTKPNAHPRREIIKMFRHASELWTLDDEGKLHVWSGQSGMPSLDSTPRSFRVPRGHSCSVIVGHHLWFATGKDIRVFNPSAASEANFQVLLGVLAQEGTGEVTCGTMMSSKPDLVFFGHTDGKVSIYDKNSFKCLGVVAISPYKISSLAGVGDYLWAGYNTGMVYVYDTSVTPWRVMKDWRAHDNPVCSIITDRQSIWKMDRLQVLSLGLDNMVRVWDGMLREDWLETKMQQNDDKFCNFEELTAAVLTWNAGASKPNFLRNDEKDNNFFRDYLSSNISPDIFIFGFQELVDLEDKKMTAKSFFKSKKKDPTEQEHMSHQYRAWRDHLTRCLEDFMPTDQSYTLLHTASMVGLFSCVFVRSSIRSRIQQVHTAEVKRGMGGLHGNKVCTVNPISVTQLIEMQGALIIRLILDDSSVCLVNCHLAAGQTHTMQRNNDIAAILESECLPPVVANNTGGTFVGGGDGSMILDHEICILNGDLNYRIDAMPRDAVVRAVREKNLTKLLERDQLLASRKKNPGFRLRVFQELPITFAPTYKYNVGTDDYDTSEKKRAPAWCDRVLYRGLGRVKCDDYRRWEVRVSDHRPVSARLRIRIKKVDEQRRRKVWDQMEDDYEKVSARIGDEVK